MSMKFSSVPFLALFMLAACTPGSTGEETVQTSNKGFEESISLQGVSFLIQCPNQGSINTLTITPSGLEGKNEPIVLEIEGSVTNAESEAPEVDRMAHSSPTPVIKKNLLPPSFSPT
jgi:hypothetical protein